MGNPPSLTPTQIDVYVALVNPSNPKYPRTQTEVVHYLGMPKTTVNYATRELLRKKLIKAKHRGRRDILYFPYHHQKYITEVLKEYGLGNGAGVGTTDDYVPTVRAHLSGGWLWYAVERAGEYIVPSPDNPKEKTELFTGEYQLKGSTNYTGSITWEGETFNLRLMRTTTKTKLAVSPPSLCVVAEQIPENDDLRPFAHAIMPVLDYLEKFDWKFLASEGTYYDYYGKTQIEYGFDDHVTDLLDDFLPEGVPGVSPIFKDSSPKAFGASGERETRQYEIANAILTAHETKAEVQNLRLDNAEIWATIDEVRAMLAGLADNQRRAVSYLVRGDVPE